MILRTIEYELSRDLYGGRLLRPCSEMSGCVLPRMAWRPPVPWMRLTSCTSPVLLQACGPGCCCCLSQVWRSSSFHASSGSIMHRSRILMRGATQSAAKLLPVLPAASAWRATRSGQLSMDQGSPCNSVATGAFPAHRASHTNTGSSSAQMPLTLRAGRIQSPATQAPPEHAGPQAPSSPSSLHPYARACFAYQPAPPKHHRTRPSFAAAAH